MKTKLRLFIAEKQSRVNSDYEIIKEIMQAAFGSKKSTQPTEEDLANIPKTSAEAIAKFKSIGF